MKENNTTPNKKRRLISSMVAGAFLATAIALGAGFSYNITKTIETKDEINDLQDDLMQISIAIQASEEFQQEFSAKYQQYTDAYNNNLLSEQEYNTKIINLTSIDAVKDYAIKTAKLNSDSIENDFVEIDNKISIKREENNERALPLIFSAMGSIGALGTGFAIIQDTIDSKYDIKKQENNLQM